MRNWDLVAILMYGQSIEIGAVAIAVQTANSNDPGYTAHVRIQRGGGAWGPDPPPPEKSQKYRVC